MKSDLIEISQGEDDDDGIFLLNGAVASTTVDFSCSPLIRSNRPDDDASQMRISGEKENVSGGSKLSVERQKMKKKKKGFNLRKSLAWNHAFFTDEGVLDPTELSMLSEGLGGEMLSVIDEGSESLSGDVEPDLQAGNDNLSMELPSSSVKKGQKSTGNIISRSLPGSCSKDKKLSSVSAVKRKILSAQDINRSASKRSGGPSLSVPSSPLKRPSNLNTTRAAGKEPNVSKLSTAKPDQLVNSAANRSSKPSVNPSKCNQKTLPAINSKKNVATKATFTNTRSSTSTVRSGPVIKPILKCSIRPARNVVKPVLKASTNIRDLTVNAAKTDIKSDSAVSVAQLPPDGHNGRTDRISVSFGASTGQALPQAAKPSGLRMPSPSLRFFDQSKPGSSQGLLQKSKLVGPTESAVCASKVGTLRPPLPPRKITAELGLESSIVPIKDLNSLGKLKSDLEVNDIQKVDMNFSCEPQNLSEKKHETQLSDVCDVGSQMPDAAILAEPSKVENKDAKLKNTKFLSHGTTTCDPLKKDDAGESFTHIDQSSREFVLDETNSGLSRHVNHSIEINGLTESKSTSCNEICIDTQFIDMNNSSNDLSDRLEDMKEQSEKHPKLTETGSQGVCSLSSMNSLMLEASGLSNMKSLTQSQICEDTQSIDMDICSESGTSEVYEDLPGKMHGMHDQLDEQAKPIETDFHEVHRISIMNSPLLPVNDDILSETAHPEELSKRKSLEVADCSVQQASIPSKPAFSCNPFYCQDLEHRKDETTGMDNLSCEVQQDVADAPVLCVDDNLVNGSGKNTLSAAAANNSLSMIVAEEDKKDGFPCLCGVEEGGCGALYQDTDFCQASQCVMLQDPDPCENELRKANNHSVITDASSAMCAEDEHANICVATEEEKGLPFEDQQDNNASCVKSISSEETNSCKDELISSSVLASTPLFEHDCGVDTNGEIFMHVESAPTVTDVEQVVQIIEHQLHDEASSLGLERTDEDNLMFTSQRSPVLVGNNSNEESTMGESEINPSVLHNCCSTGGEMGNEIQQSLEQDKMTITDCFHDTEQENQNQDAHDGFMFDDGRSIEDPVKAENVISSETIATGSTGSVTPHVFRQVQRTEEASQVSFKETAMQNAQDQLSYESLFADRCNTNCSVECIDYLMAPNNIHEQPEEQSVLENLQNMIAQICEESHGLSSDDYWFPREISTVEEEPEDPVPSGTTNDVLEQINGCSTEPETLIVGSLQTSATQVSGLEEERKTELTNDTMVSGSLEVEPSVENVNTVMVADCEEDGKHRNQFEPLLKKECQEDPLAENSNGDEVDNDTSTIENMQETIEANLLVCETLAAKDENRVIEGSTDQSDLHHEMDAAANNENVTESPDSKDSVTEKRNAPAIKPPPNAAPFSDEWLAAFEAAGEEVLTMKSGAVQNSPPDKSQPEPSPWSPVKRKNNQGIGPYDCTKYSNTGIPPSTSS